MTTTPATVSLTRGETASLTQSHHLNRPLTCEVSPSLTQSQSQSHTQSHSLTTLRSETTRLRDETNPNSTNQPNHHAGEWGPHGRRRGALTSWMTCRRGVRVGSRPGCGRRDQRVTSGAVTCGDVGSTGLIVPSGSLGGEDAEHGAARPRLAASVARLAAPPGARVVLGHQPLVEAHHARAIAASGSVCVRAGVQPLADVGVVGVVGDVRAAVGHGPTVRRGAVGCGG